MGDDIGSFRFVNLLNQSNQPNDHPFPDLEFDEADVFYSSTVDSSYDSSYGYHYESPPSVDHHDHNILNHRRFGLSALLADSEAEPMASAPQPVPFFAHTDRGGPHQSAPQAVPMWHGRTGYDWDSEERRDADDEVFDQETEMVPPHVMVARSHTPTAFSVLEGAGRTLKGRDLRRVRNAVWQKTGFLDL